MTHKKRRSLIIPAVLAITGILIVLLMFQLVVLHAIRKETGLSMGVSGDLKEALSDAAEDFDSSLAVLRTELEVYSKKIYFRRYNNRINYLQKYINEVWFQDIQKNFPYVRNAFFINRQGRVMVFAPYNEKSAADRADRNAIYVDKKYGVGRYFSYTHKRARKNREGMFYHYLADETIISQFKKRGETGKPAYIWRAKYGELAPFLWPYQIDDIGDNNRALFTKQRRKWVDRKTIEPEHTFLKNDVSPFISTESNVGGNVPYIIAVSYLWEHTNPNLSLGFVGLVLDWEHIRNVFNKSDAGSKLDVYILHRDGFLVFHPKNDNRHVGEYLGNNEYYTALRDAMKTLTNHTVVTVKHKHQQMYLAALNTPGFEQWVVVGIPQQSMAAGWLTNNLTIWVILLVALEISLFVILILLFNRYAIAPWRKYAEYLRKKENKKIELFGFDEYDDIATITDRYMKDLESYRIFGRPMNVSMRKKYENDPSAFNLNGNEMVGSVIHLKIQNFGILEKALSAAVIIKLVNEFYEHIEPIISEYQGYIESITGESLTIIYGAPVATDKPAYYAIETVKKIIAQLDDFNRKYAEQLNNLPLTIGMGVATGTIYCGQIHTPEGNYYTLLGQTLIFAQQFESIAKNKVAIIGENTYNQCDPKPDIDRIVTLKVRDVDHPLQVYVLK